LCDVAPVRGHGFDHATQLAYSAAAGAAKILRLDVQQIANAVALSGTALNSLRVTRTGALSHWKGLADPFAAAAALQLVLMARQGITAPMEVFEGNKGFMDAVAGHFKIDWMQEGLDRLQHTLLKKYNAETHSQTAIEAVLQLRAEHDVDPAQVRRVDVEIFDVAHNIIGGGEEGDKTVVRTKEEADHSLPYVLAVALLDRQVMPQQYRPERIRQQDVQEMLRRVFIHPNAAYSARFPDAMMARVRITLESGRGLECEIVNLESPSWRWAQQKFDLLASTCTSPEQRAAIVDIVANLERLSVADLTNLLAKIRRPGREMPQRAA
jgi:2-methylcitrate dehydratase